MIKPANYKKLLQHRNSVTQHISYMQTNLTVKVIYNKTSLKLGNASSHANDYSLTSTKYFRLTRGSLFILQ